MSRRTHLTYALLFAAGVATASGTLATLGMAAQDRAPSVEQSPQEEMLDREMADLLDLQTMLRRELREKEQTHGPDSPVIATLRNRLDNVANDIERQTRQRERRRNERERAAAERRMETRHQFLPKPVDLHYASDKGVYKMEATWRNVEYVETLEVGGERFAAFKADDGEMRLIRPELIAAMTPTGTPGRDAAVEMEDSVEEVGDAMEEAVDDIE